MISLREFNHIGREHKYTPQLSFPIRAFTWLFGPINIHPRIRSGHVIRTIQQLGLSRESRVLDAGCGRGLTLFWLATRYPDYQLSLHGIDIDTIKIARNRIVAQKMELTTFLTFEKEDLSTISIPAETYDLIFSIDVLEHIWDDVRVLRVMRSALKPNGILLLHLPLRHQNQRRIFPAFKNHIVADHVRDEYLPDEIQAKLEETGFEMQDLRYGFGWQGELAFELNNLFWEFPPLRALLALLTYPLVWYLAYRDINTTIHRGNSMIILAKPKI